MTKSIPDAALDDRLAFVGTSGSGKTYAAARDTVEQETGYKRATRDAYILRLRVRELVETVSRRSARWRA